MRCLESDSSTDRCYEGYDDFERNAYDEHLSAISVCSACPMFSIPPHTGHAFSATDERLVGTAECVQLLLYAGVTCRRTTFTTRFLATDRDWTEQN